MVVSFDRLRDESFFVLLRYGWSFKTSSYFCSYLLSHKNKDFNDVPQQQKRLCLDKLSCLVPELNR